MKKKKRKFISLLLFSSTFLYNVYSCKNNLF